MKGREFLLDLLDSGAHTAENMYPRVLEAIKDLRGQAGCAVATVVSDNAANMESTRRLLLSAQLKEVDHLSKVVETLDAGTPRHSVCAFESC